VWYLFLFGVAAAIAFLVWDLRRKAVAREAASKQRFEEMLLVRPTAAAKLVSPAATISAPGRFLGQSETLIYRLLKAGIPDHDIFANVTLASVIGGGNEQEARRLSPYRLDFVVCDKAMQVVAVVEMEAAGGMQAAGEKRFKADNLKAAGVRLVYFDAVRLPRRDEMRALVCGHPGSPAQP
jgi:hypothetical protein